MHFFLRDTINVANVIDIFEHKFWTDSFYLIRLDI